MQNPYENIEFQRELSLYRKKISEAAKGRGSIIAVEGESGFGKSYLLEGMHVVSSEKSSGMRSIFVEAQRPIGDYKIGSIQPLLPFSRAVEKLITGEKEGDPHKQLIKNIGLTALAVLPGIGEVAYAVKEIGRDWRQYKKEQSSSSKKKKISSAAADFYDSICSFADKKPVALHIDDMHWCDAQSVELLSLFAENIKNLPIVIAISYRKSELMRHGSPLLSFLDQFSETEAVEKLQLKEYSQNQISSMARFLLKDYKPDERFEKWLLENTYGVPGVVAEYLKYFLQNPPFDEEGRLKEDFDKADYLPASVHTAFSKIVSKLSEEERNTLAVCSAEGSEFTALIASELMNNDVLTTIKKLRHLQNKTTIIKSQGAELRYGVKTTVYRFTQAFYYNFFHKSLEYEEHQALHGHITSILKKKYDEAGDEKIRRSIAPYLAAHSHEAGEEDIEKSMLLAAAKTAQEYGSSEVINAVYENYNMVGKKAAYDEEGSEEFDPEDFAFRQIVDAANSTIIGSNGDTNEDKNDTLEEKTNLSGVFDFKQTRKAITEIYLSGNYSQAADLAKNSLENFPAETSPSEKIQLQTLAARAYLEDGKTPEAKKLLDNAKMTIETANDAVSECLLLNTQAVFDAYEGRLKEASITLKQAAERSLHLPPEIKLLTMANIALVLKEFSPAESQNYFSVVKKLSESLNFNEFKEDFLHFAGIS